MPVNLPAFEVAFDCQNCGCRFKTQYAKGDIVQHICGRVHIHSKNVVGSAHILECNNCGGDYISIYRRNPIFESNDEKYTNS